MPRTFFNRTSFAAHIFSIRFPLPRTFFNKISFTLLKKHCILTSNLHSPSLRIPLFAVRSTGQELDFNIGHLARGTNKSCRENACVRDARACKLVFRPWLQGGIESGPHVLRIPLGCKNACVRHGKTSVCQIAAPSSHTASGLPTIRILRR